MRTRSTLALILVSLASAACGGSGDGPAPDHDPDGGTGAELFIEWTPCPLRSEDGSGEGAECAVVDVPLRWDEPDGPTIELFVKRVLAPGGGRRQLWLLNGGPGGPGSDWEPFVEGVAELVPDTDFYLPDHRGTGRSTRLGCPAEGDETPGGITVTDSEMAGCIESLQETWGDRLGALRTTEAARDLGWFIDETRRSGVPVHVLGGSYGTYWAQRYLQLFPDQPDAVTLFGIAPPTITFAPYDARFDDAGNDYLRACSEDAFCADRLGADPVVAAREVLERLDEGHCPGAAEAGFTRATLRQVFAAIVFFSWYERALVPAMVYRLARCAPRDVAALRHFGGVFSSHRASSVAARHQAPLLGLNIGLSELWTEPSPELADLQEVVDRATFSTETSTRHARHHDAWPRYVADELDGAWASYSGPMLMMNGTLDPATTLSLAAVVGEHFVAPGQHFVVLPGATHSWIAPIDGGGSCIFDLLVAFLTDPSAPLDQSCVDHIAALDFEGTSALAAAAFGTGHLYDNGVAATAAASDVDQVHAHLDVIADRAERLGW